MARAQQGALPVIGLHNQSLESMRDKMIERVRSNAGGHCSPTWFEWRQALLRAPRIGQRLASGAIEQTAQRREAGRGTTGSAARAGAKRYCFAAAFFCLISAEHGV
jgi:hypothetical protein